MAIINYYDPEVFKKLKTDCYNAARDGKKIDYSSYPAAEYKYFTELYKSCSMFFHKKITQDELVQREKEIKKQYDDDVERYMRYNALLKQHQEAIKVSSELCTALCINPMKLPEDVEAALKTCLEIISAMRGENVTQKTVLEKWGYKP